MEGKRFGGVASKEFFGNRALYFDYKCDKRPFYIRFVLEKHEKVAILESKEILFVACWQQTLYLKYAIHWN